MVHDGTHVVQLGKQPNATFLPLAISTILFWMPLLPKPASTI